MNTVKLANAEPFNVMVVSPNKIQHLDWKSPTYLHDLANGEYNMIAEIKPENYIETIGKILDIENKTNPAVDTKVIAEIYISEEYNMIIEIMFVVHDDNYNGDDINEFATLLDVYDNKIYGNVIVMCTMIANNNNNMYFDNMTPNILEKMLYSRANTKVITYDADEESYIEKEVFGPLDQFADDFF